MTWNENNQYWEILNYPGLEGPIRTFDPRNEPLTGWEVYGECSGDYIVRADECSCPDPTTIYYMNCDYTNPTYHASVSAAGRLLVSTQAPTPPSSTAVVQTAYSDMSGTVDSVYTIPNGVTVNIQRFIASAAVDTTAEIGRAHV